MKVVRIFHAGRDEAFRDRDRALARAGIDVTLVVPSAWPGPDEITDEPFRIAQIPTRRDGDINRHTYDPAGLRAVLHRVQPQVVDIQAEPYSSATRQVLRMIGSDQPAVGYTAQNLDKRFPPPFWAWERQALARLNGLYPCSCQAASVAVGKGFRGPVEVLGYAAADVMTPGDQRHPGTGLRMLLVGRMEAYKGVADAVQALADLPQATLELVGSGPALAAAEKQARILQVADRLTLTPWLPAAELAERYRAAHVLLAPSRTTPTWVEQFGRMVVEAQACGAVVVGYASGALPEVVGEAGVLVPEGDQTALRSALVDLAANPQRWADLRSAGIAQRRTWDDIAERQIGLYERALTGPSRRWTSPDRASAQRTWGPPASGSQRPWALPKLPARATPVRAARLKVVYLDHVALLSGGELALTRLLPSLPDVEAHVILAEDGPLRGLLEAAGASVEILPMAEGTRRMHRDAIGFQLSAVTAACSAAAYAVRLARRLGELQPDLVHANSLKSGYYGGVAARLAGIPMVWHLRDRIAEDYLPSAAVRATRLAVRTLPAGVIANSDATLAAAHLPPSPARMTIVDSVSLAAVRRTPTEGTVGIVGRISPWKGQDVFLRALARLPGVHGRVIGSAMFGEDAWDVELKRLAASLGIQDRVTFVGFSDDVPGELGRLALLVHASTIPEPFGQVIIEGMAAGVPVIATAGGGASEIVTDGQDGLLVAPGDDDALARAIDRVLGDQDLRARLTLGGLERARDFDPSINGPRVRAFYDQVLG